jgi:hypothetical protein
MSCTVLGPGAETTAVTRPSSLSMLPPWVPVALRNSVVCRWLTCRLPHITCCGSWFTVFVLAQSLKLHRAHPLPPDLLQFASCRLLEPRPARRGSTGGLQNRFRSARRSRGPLPYFSVQVLSVRTAELHHAFARPSLTPQKMQFCAPSTDYIGGIVSVHNGGSACVLLDLPRRSA